LGIFTGQDTIHVDVTKYINSKDYTTSTTRPSVTILSNDDPAAPYIKNAEDFRDAVNSANIPYHVLGPNSNSVLEESATAVTGTQPPAPPVLALGFNSPLGIEPAAGNGQNAGTATGEGPSK
jgi:hypothetical protein